MSTNPLSDPVYLIVRIEREDLATVRRELHSLSKTTGIPLADMGTHFEVFDKHGYKKIVEDAFELALSAAKKKQTLIDKRKGAN